MSAVAVSLKPREEEEIVDVKLRGQLDVKQLQEQLAPVERRIGEGNPPKALIVDCLDMTGYEGTARRYFVEWNATHRDSLNRLAVVLSNPLWKMVVSAMSLASGQVMKAFSSPSEARAWAEQG